MRVFLQHLPDMKVRMREKKRENERKKSRFIKCDKPARGADDGTRTRTAVGH